MPKLIYLLGVTCAGKDYFVEKALERYPNLFGAVQVGKEMRRRYPPGHFQGSGAPDYTQKEALEIFVQQLEQNADKRVVFVVGQPRRVSQIAPTIIDHPGEILFLGISQEKQVERMMHRFKDDPAGMLLASQRIFNDRVQLFDVLFHLLDYKVAISCHDGDNIDTLIDSIAQRAIQ